MLTVACVLKSGGIYSPLWVERLRAQVASNLPTAGRFVCLSDVEVSCERIPLLHNWPGWWSKIELFKMIHGPVLFVGDLSDIANQCARGPLTVLRDFYRLENGVGSGVMGWNGNFSFIYDKFRAASDTWIDMFRGGDQRFIEATVDLDTVIRWQDVLPGQLASYKVHCVRPNLTVGSAATIPDGPRIICLHGQPKFADMPPTDEIRLRWEQAA